MMRSPAAATSIALLLLFSASCSTVANALSLNPLRRRNAIRPGSSSLEAMQGTATKRRFWKVPSRPRATLEFDPHSGEVTSASYSSKEYQKQEGRRSPSKWRNFKSTVYGTFDTVSSLGSKIRRNKTQQRRPRSGYGDVVESTGSAYLSQAESPGQRLMEQYQQVQMPSAPLAQASALQEDSLFDSLKETLYSAADSVSTAVEDNNAQAMPQQIQTFKPGTQPNIAASLGVQAALAQLQSGNFVQRWRASRKIKQWEEEQRRGQEALERQQQIDAFKDGVYTVVDTVEAGVEILVKTPGRVVKTAENTQQAAASFVSWASTIPGAVQSAAETVAAIPAQVKETVTTAKKSAEETVQNTQEFVQEVASIPGKVVQTVEDTKRNVDNTAKAIDEAVTTVQVWTGQKEPEPEPPKEIKPSDIAWSVVGGVASAGAKAAWWVGKGAAQFGWKGAQNAFANVVASRNAESTKPQPMMTTEAEKIPSPPVMPPPPDVIRRAEQSLFVEGEEVDAALNLAQKAIDFADSSSDGEMDGLEAAVRRAKAAAIAATEDETKGSRRMKKK